MDVDSVTAASTTDRCVVGIFFHYVAGLFIFLVDQQMFSILFVYVLAKKFYEH